MNDLLYFFTLIIDDDGLSRPHDGSVDRRWIRWWDEADPWWTDTTAAVAGEGVSAKTCIYTVNLNKVEQVSK